MRLSLSITVVAVQVLLPDHLGRPALVRGVALVGIALLTLADVRRVRDRLARPARTGRPAGPNP